MASTTHKAYTAAASTVLSTELNSLANATDSSASSAIDNTSNLDLYFDVEVVIAAQGSARSAGAVVLLYMTRALDGTNYDDANSGTADLVATFALDAATTARRVSRQDIPATPGLFKLFLRNVTGQALASSGSTVKIRFHSLTTV